LITFMPGLLMYGSWQLIHPSTETGRMLVLLLFWTFGGSISLLFLVLGVDFWARSMIAIVKA
jgi:hypothetical protein